MARATTRSRTYECQPPCSIVLCGKTYFYSSLCSILFKSTIKQQSYLCTLLGKKPNWQGFVVWMAHSKRDICRFVSDNVVCFFCVRINIEYSLRLGHGDLSHTRCCLPFSSLEKMGTFWVVTSLLSGYLLGAQVRILSLTPCVRTQARGWTCLSAGWDRKSVV